MVGLSDPLLEGLNPAQRDAIEHVDGPLLIVAGPGSGKTRVITHRIAYLNSRVGISPGRIAAVTFTNRAAREMRHRLQRLMGDRAHYLTAGTFHALCAMILRRDGEPIGVPKDFVIMDDEDQISLIKRSMELANVDPKRFPPRAVLSMISSAKSQLRGPEGFAAAANSYYEEIVHRIFVQYQGFLDRSHAVDFDDLLSKTVELMRQSLEVRTKYQDRFIHLMVDEFQDTNIAQYQIAKELAAGYRNLAVVGDPDQSIYAWRNADIRNILSFQKDHPEAKVVHLSQNYRSTSTILDAAQHVIRPNSQRIEHQLFTENEQGTPIYVAESYTEEEEAQSVLREIQRLMETEGFSLRDCVVTYRVNAQSRALEEACLRQGVPYKLVGGVRFYQRREIKDLLAYLRLIQDPYDEVSLTRIINVPARGIGKRTVDELMAWARTLEVPAYTALQVLSDESSSYSPPFDTRQKRQLGDFVKLINGLRSGVNELPLPELLDEITERSGYRKALLESDDVDTEDRLDNIREFRALAGDFLNLPPNEGLAAFIESATLVADQDALDEDEQQYLTLITLHQIKGLEYPVVFITGMEEGLLPHMRSMDNPDQLEEERRLAYVGMTRARKHLYLMRSLRRRMYGMMGPGVGSRFLRDIPRNLTEVPDRPQRTGTRISPTTPDNAHIAGSQPIPEAPTEPPPFKAGDKVQHDSFGAGIVVSCAPRPGDYEITVAFLGNSGIRRLLHSYAKLNKVVS